MGRSLRQKVNMKIMALNVTSDQINLIDIYRTFHSKTVEYTFFFQVHMDHSPGDITY